MGVLPKAEIISRLKKGELLRNAHLDADGNFDVEPASYDLHSGIIIWKDINKDTGASTIRREDIEKRNPPCDQPIVTLQPGQVMFVITKEEVLMPKELCGTVYAKNKFSRDGILALTTGHVDPGVHCPIVIRLINLRSIPFTFQIGEPIYTIVFHTLEKSDSITYYGHTAISMSKTIAQTIASADAALENTLHDISLTQKFIRKEDFAKIFAKQFFKTIWGWLVVLFLLISAFAGILKIIDFYKPHP